MQINAITLATNVSRIDIITQQLGDIVSIVTGPERCDTFPAVALATSYLKFSKGCNNDVIAIMPCDPYTDAGYFQTIAKMIECVEQNVADLVLMGITPTYPSEKYGYIIPQEEVLEESKGFLKVSRFTEKPSAKVAEKLLKQDVLWNGGVFAFHLGYMMDIVHKYIQSDSFEDIRDRYQEFPKYLLITK